MNIVTLKKKMSNEVLFPICFSTIVQRQQSPLSLEFYLDSIELSVKYVQKKKLRANFIKIGISTSQRATCNLVVVLKQV
jgi:hypothetical protein